MEPLGFSGQVKLTPLEEKLFGVFRQAAVKSGKPVVLRVAGGWVRDKVGPREQILGRENDDIDIALDCMMGAEFAALVQQVYAESTGAAAKGFGVIKANPDKSKHLEAATIQLEGYSRLTQASGSTSSTCEKRSTPKTPASPPSTSVRHSRMPSAET